MGTYKEIWTNLEGSKMFIGLSQTLELEVLCDKLKTVSKGL